MPPQIRRNEISGKISLISLTKAFYTAKKYREGKGDKKSLIGEKIYKEFSTKFWLKPVSSFDQAHNESVRRLSSASSSASTHPSSSSERKSVTCSSDVSPVTSRPVTPSTIETPPISRSVTPTIPSFSQNANVINVAINYGGGIDEKHE
ncbi:hypothetical protein GLOIN_2v1571918 [Rhizophagus clarus]|uniref:Uncharacterized protein n=1 Tax=Rhizophagus clarus TaxID=94130 RepID=A0A8H3LHB1_9GLOM|nr:hypothetical protein GLOIN_2v1571918 [Rhizophagus clarus]